MPARWSPSAGTSSVATLATLQLDQGSELDATLTFYQDAAQTLPINLTGYTAKAGIASAYGNSPIVTLLPGSGLTLGGAAGTIALTITVSQIAKLTDLFYVWMLVVTDTLNVPHRWLQGPVTVSPWIPL